MIAEIISAAVAPFTDPTGWQAFAYGLLGVETIKQSVRKIIKLREANNE